MSVEKRPTCAGDSDFLWRLYAATRSEELAAWGLPPEQQRHLLEMQYRARCQGYAASFPDAEHSILVEEGVPAGAMIVARSQAELRLVDISVLPEHRGRGIGAGAIGELIREAHARARPLRLSVLRTNPAQRLYQRLGFVASGGDAVYIEMEYMPGDSSPGQGS